MQITGYCKYTYWLTHEEFSQIRGRLREKGIEMKEAKKAVCTPLSKRISNGICSACLEFFNIIGSRLVKKLVVPGPGAVLFAGMAPNRYYEVVHPFS